MPAGAVATRPRTRRLAESRRHARQGRRGEGVRRAALGRARALPARLSPLARRLIRASQRRTRPPRWLAQGWRAARQWLVSNSYYPQWLPRRLRHPSAGYLAATALQVLALLVDARLVRAMPHFEFAAVLNVLVIVLAALSWGAGPSLLATLVAVPLIEVVLLPPQIGLGLPTPRQMVEVTLFALVGGVVTIAATRSERARSAAEREALVAETARRMAEDLAASLASEQALLQAVIQAVPDVVSIHDAKGALVRLNSAGRRLAALGQAVPLTAPGTRTAGLRTLDGEPLADEQAPMARALRGEVVSGAELRFTTAGGDTRYLSVSAAPLRDALGQVSGVVTAARDVTERVGFERRARASLRALLAVAESLVSIEGGVHGADAADDAGESRDALGTSRRLAEIMCHLLNFESVRLIAVDPANGTQQMVASAGREDAGASWWQAFAAGGQAGRTPDGGLTPAELGRLRAGELIAPRAALAAGRAGDGAAESAVLLAPMRVGDELVGIMALTVEHGLERLSAEDRELIAAAGNVAALVFERVRLLRERASAQARAMALQEAGERMDEFLAIASHEIKTPLTAIKASAQLAARQLPPPGQPVKRHDEASLLSVMRMELTRIDRQSQRLTRLVQDLLDASRARAGSLALRPVRCDLVALVDECVRDQRQVSQQGRIRWNPPACEPLVVEADPDRIAQVLTNYLSNALKYSAADQPVTVALEAGEGVVTVRVSDRGPGVPAGERERVWDRFYRVDGISVRAGSGVGLGLGLFICRAIIEGHGGQVGVESAPGEGSSFWFSLPVG